jgi:hypothetical protein
MNWPRRRLPFLGAAEGFPQDRIDAQGDPSLRLYARPGQGYERDFPRQSAAFGRAGPLIL